MVAAARELTDPVAYSPWLLVVAIALPVVVVAWYAGVTWWARERRDRAGWREVARARRNHLRRLDEVEAAVAAGEMSARAAHQRISVLVRSYVEAVSPLGARSMALEQLRATTTAELAGVADVVELVYPPAFQPGDQGEPVERLEPALHDARAVVATWRP